MTQTSASTYTDVNENGLLDLDVYFDFLCPFTWQASKWVRQISELMGADVISVRWRFFSLEHNNKSQNDPNFKIWEQKPGGDLKGLLAFSAGGVAHAIGGDAALDKFYTALGRMLHEEGLPIWEQANIEKAWQEAGLDSAALKGVFDGSDKRGLEKLQSDHTEAVERYGAFGSPTLVFEEHRSFYLKLMPAPEDIDEALELFQHIQRMAMGFRGGVYEFKRTIPKGGDEHIKELTSTTRKALGMP